MNFTTPQQQYLQRFIHDYNQRTPKSKQLAEQNRPYFADHKASIIFTMLLKEICYPIAGDRSIGSKIWDIDGNEYLDFSMGYGVNLFGHNPPFIKQAISEQLERGIHLGLGSEIACEVAETICQLTNTERVALSNTGTEAVMTAIRLARTATNRSKIALFSGSYHGHFDGTLVKNQTLDNTPQALPLAPGVPASIVKDVLVLDYGNPKSFDLIKQYQQELAAVLVEPVQTSNLSLQPKEFLHQLRKFTQDNNIALIFDEMVTGFRIHPGGAQAWFNIEADLATYGKIVGGGMPIGVIAGKAKYMNAIDGGIWNYGDRTCPQAKKTFFAGTYCKHPLAMATARAVLLEIKSQGVPLQQQLTQRTAELVATLNAYFIKEKLPLKMVHFGSLFAVNFTEDCTSPDIVALLLYYNLIHQGILFRELGGFLSTAHTEEDLNYLINTIKNIIAELTQAVFLSKEYVLR
ncbi:aspartate aminotransferase family protein [Myxosarcina sp. GI1]|uniref:aspartate aminotransferase family protein n=1 Tax=Myxosarcina sp. GI1 TaxID=1541065 RepID=UPI000B1B62C3|nr:aspartate aminotransferase family protein [Myxosarcina sp. GI1]